MDLYLHHYSCIVPVLVLCFLFTVLTSGFLFAGQIELYTHLPVMKQLVEQLQQWEFRVCGVFLVDSQFMVESFKVTDDVFICLLGSPMCVNTQFFCNNVHLM